MLTVGQYDGKVLNMSEGFSVSLFQADHDKVCHQDRFLQIPVLLPALVLPSVFVLSLVGFLYLRYIRKKHDGQWSIAMKELKFWEPIELLGRGSFGMVVKAEYRGTFVAVKRVFPPSSSKPTIFDSDIPDSHFSRQSLEGKVEGSTRRLWLRQSLEPVQSERIINHVSVQLGNLDGGVVPDVELGGGTEVNNIFSKTNSDNSLGGTNFSMMHNSSRMSLVDASFTRSQKSSVKNIFSGRQSQLRAGTTLAPSSCLFFYKLTASIR